MKIPEPLIPGDIPEEKVPSLLKNWFLGSRARRYLSRRRFVTVTGMLPVKSGARALDVGCGWGYNLFLLREAGYDPVGIDIVQDDFTAASMIARENGYAIDLVGGDMSSLPFARGRFDAVTAIETMEHVFYPDRMDAVREVARILGPGGDFVFSTPNYYSIVETAKRLIVRFPGLKRLLPTMCYPVGDVSREDYHPYSY
ncbi:MAG TPA: methyltransferase domain-containing protein, partial [Candidatus Krumholzibacterium sp.]|nr:methyltransferase domain-containing protein [Candidatus Krumholzibacterium sp.]